MATLETLTTPTGTTAAERIEWAGERIADLAEGKLTKSEASIVWNYLVGWSDLCSEDERRQYLALARSVQELMAA